MDSESWLQPRSPKPASSAPASAWRLSDPGGARRAAPAFSAGARSGPMRQRVLGSHVAAFSLSTLRLCPIVSCSSKAPLVADAVYITWKYCKFRRCVKTSKQVCIALDAPTSSAQSNEGALQASSRHFCLAASKHDEGFSSSVGV